ncbi:MAG TPA: phosphatase PAP2 family protein [Candidatus Limnocylindrales bacterium]|nr:phosphatase PAP2 family protein [Candidatus Limnocylindrales bacterium]
MTDEVGAPDAATPAVVNASGDVAVGAVDPALGRRNDRLLVALVAGYIVVLSALMIVRGVSITPDVLLVALGLAAVIVGRGRLFLRDWIPFIGLFFAYELMRGYADNLGLAVHVGDVLAIERTLFGGQVPTATLQAALHPATGVDVVAVVATVFYFLHFPLPIAVAFFLWLRRRRAFYDYVAALIVLSMAGFITYLLLPVAPPWYAAKEGLLPGVTYLKDQGFQDLARLFGFEGRYLFSYTVYQINPNQVAAFPSLHAGYPFLAFLFARRSFGRIGWLMLAYSACVWFSIVYLADHYVVDIVGGLAYAAAAYWGVIHAPSWFRRAIDRAADDELSADPADDRVPRRHVDRGAVRQGLVIAAVAVFALVVMANGGLGGSATPLFLVPWFALLGGGWRAASALLAR